MSEAEVLYSDVRFTKERGRAHVNTSSPTETPYSEVKTFKKEPSTELPGPQKSNRRFTVTSERAVLVVLCVLLLASVIALGLSSYKNSQLTDELDAVKRNLTEKEREVKAYNILQSTGRAAAECPNLEKCWEQHRGKCYYFSNTVLTWEQSRDQCRSYRGDLVKIDSGEEQTFLELRLREKMNLPEDKFWIGLTDSETEGRWLWADGSPLDPSFIFWSSREPDNWEGEDRDGEDCVRMGEKLGAPDLKCWFDKTCKVPHRYICEKQQTRTTQHRFKCVSPTT
ncbi:hepatic lectin-like [Centropristis striata]|uniref:hepatic lectin-like n=1 Tax=Centropristis striata TaxID=184440 RepID=UPI0027DF30D0|nr:hepatic lectin-like [Centropristis striata]